MHLDVRAGRGRVELGDPAGLGAALVLGEHPAGGQVQGVGGVRLLVGRAVGDGGEAGPAVRGGEAVQEQPPGARVVLGRAGPEHPVLGGDPGVADARVVGVAAGRGAAQLVEGLLGLDREAVGREALRHSEPGGQLAQHPQFAADALRRVEGPAAQDHPALQVGGGAVLLRPLGDGQDDVREPGGLGEHQVGDDQQVQRAQPLGDVPGVGRGHRRVGAGQQQRLHPARFAEAVQQLVGRFARAGDRRGVDAPDGGDVFPRRRVLDRAVAGQLVGLLAVLAPALAVALAGQAAVTAVRAAGLAGGQAEVDPGADGVGALAVLLGAARGEHHAGLRLAEQPCGLAESVHGDAGDPLHPVRPVRHRRGAGLLEAGGPPGDELLVHQAVRDHQVEQAEGQRQVPAGAGLQVQVGQFGGAGAARVDHDQRAAGLPQFAEVADGRRHRPCLLYT